MPGNQVRVGVGVSGAKGAASELDRLRDKFARLQKQGAKGLAIGAGVAATNLAFHAAGRAIGAVTDLIGDATRAFIEDEASQVKLRTSLRANVVAWDGNTAAIEGTLQARMALGFSDDEQRESLSSLVAAYGDVTKALEVQRLAMDLARFSGTDLASASDTLVKVHAGNYRALKALGINTKNVKDETSALAAVQKVAAGQAEAFTTTLEGRLAVAATKSAEALEHLGEATAEFSADFETTKAGAIEGFVAGLDHVADSINYANQSLGRQIEIQRGAVMAWRGVTEAQRDAALAELDHAAALLRSADRTKDDIIPAMAKLATETDDAADEVGDLVAALDRIDRIAGTLPDKLDDLTDALFGKAQRKGDIAEAKRDLDELLDTEPKKGTRAWTIWAGDVAAARERLFELQFQMQQAAGPEALDGWLRKQKEAFGKTNQKALDYLNTLIAINSLNLKPGLRAALGSIATGGRFDGKIVPLADGGHYSAGVPRIVGEKGPEIDVPSSSGTIIPNHAISSGGGGSTVVNINVSTPALTPGGAEALARAIGPALGTYMRGRGWIGA